MTDKTDKTAPLIWETDLPLFSRVMLKQWTGAMLATALVMALILGTILAAQREWEGLPFMLGMVAMVSAGLWLLGLAIMALLFGGRYRVRYTLSERELRCDTLDRVAKKANRLAIVVGVLARKPGLAGAGLIGRSRESEAVRWNGAFLAAPDPRRHLIALRNRWRSVMLVQCTPENFATVQARIDAAMRIHETASRVEKDSPLPFYLGHSVLILLACVPLFMLAEEYDLHLLAPILVLCFALATLWLINLFGYVVHAGLLYLAAATLWDLAALRESTLFPGRGYRGFDVIGANEAGILLLALLGAGYLIWLSWRATHGGYLALLVRDHADMDGA